MSWLPQTVYCATSLKTGDGQQLLDNGTKVSLGDSHGKKGSVILVTGGAGFLGQHIVKLLEERTEGIKEIRVFDTKLYQNQLGE